MKIFFCQPFLKVKVRRKYRRKKMKMVGAKMKNTKKCEENGQNRFNQGWRMCQDISRGL